MLRPKSTPNAAALAVNASAQRYWVIYKARFALSLGNVTVNTVAVSSDRTAISPPWAIAIWRAILGIVPLNFGVSRYLWPLPAESPGRGHAAPRNSFRSRPEIECRRMLPTRGGRSLYPVR